MNLQRIEGFYWVAKQEGYSRAARAFPYPITQPGVHQQVRRLEDELGVKLFERVGKDRVVLTPRGRLLFEAVAPFYEGLAEVEARVKGGVVGGTLKVHAAGLVLRHVIPPWLKRLQAKRADITVALTEMTAVDLGLLRRGEADVIVDWLPQPPTEFEAREVARAHAWIALPASGPFASKGRVAVAELATTPFIAYHTDRTAKALQHEALAAHGIAPKEAFAADSSETILAFVAAGLGFSLVPSLSPTGPKVAGVVAHRLERPVTSFPIYAVWRKGSQPLAQAALECVE